MSEKKQKSNRLLEVMPGVSKNIEKASFSGVQDVSPNKPASEMTDTSLAGQPEIKALAEKMDRATVDNDKAAYEEARKKVEQKTEEKNDELTDLSYLRSEGTMDGNGISDVKGLDFWRQFAGESDNVNDYYSDSMSGAYNDLSDKDKRILLFDTLGTMLKNQGKYRPTRRGAFGQITDAGNPIGDEKSSLENLLESSLQKGLERRNKKRQSIMENSLQNIQSVADIDLAIEKLMKEGVVNRYNIEAYMKMLATMNPKIYNEYRKRSKNLGSQGFGVNTPFGGINYTSAPAVQVTPNK